ncbi:MAG: MAPEG family protein [Henriciella sp.]|nr:MAPEG family protein [Henriciella sp.]
MEIVSPPIYAALLGGALLCLQIILMLTVGTYRSNSGKGVGVADDMKLERLVRRHGNLAENAAIFIIVFALYEMLFGQTWIALTLGIVFFLARSLHALAFTSNSGSHLVDGRGAGKKFVLMRVSGALLTALSSLALGVTLIVSILLS